ncbi:MAG: hypothetical protein QM756_02620 [Polyangiaceae bacterium]
MTELEPWRQSGEAPREALELLQHAHSPSALDARTRARSRRRVAALSGVPLAAGVMLWIQNVALGAVLGGAGIALVTVPNWRGQTREATLAPVASASAAPRVSQRAPVFVPPPQPSIEPSSKPLETAIVARSTTPEVESPVAVSSPTAPSLMQEAQLLERARGLLDANPERALEVLSEHQANFARGALQLEREFLAISALVRLQRHAEAARRAEQLRRMSPQSLYDERLKQLLDGASSKP